MGRRWRTSPLSLLALAPATIHGQAALPYNPTRIFLHSNSSHAYVFGPSSSSSQSQLAAFDVSKTFAAGRPQLSTVSTELPFLQDGNGQAYAPTMDGGGNITVLSGSCEHGSREAQVWQFEPNADDTGQGTWTQYKTLYAPAKNDADYAGPGYLSNSITYSNGIDGNSVDSSIYVFGGMCPYANSTAATWISAAEYSNSILSISPDSSYYDIGLLGSRESPISQAGSSVTPLPPTFGFNSSGAMQTQQQDFVLLGGNTQAAFINMSQVALFSLPQQSWSYVTVLQPTGGKTDLAVKRDPQQITPRSGHTAVLSENGDSIIVFGGWVANVNTPAQPQLAILQLGEGYGGSGDWQWIIPDQSGDGLPSGSGIYGHGAVMLPGGIMMVLGGYEIAAPRSSSHERRATQSTNNQVFLFNTTSHTWLDSYTPPANSTKHSGGATGPSTGEKVGLATGLGIGAALLLTVVGFYVWYARRTKRAQDERDTSRLSYNSDTSMIAYADQPTLPGGLDGRGGEDSAGPRYWPSHEMAEQSYRRPPPMHHATGASVNVPSPTRGLRKGSVGRNYQYHPAPRYDDRRRNPGSGYIHPIVEDENEDEYRQLGDNLTEAESRLRDVAHVLNSDDPFSDPEPSLPVRIAAAAAMASETVRPVPVDESQIPARKPVPSPMDANWTVERDGRAGDLEDEEDDKYIVTYDDRTSSTLSERSEISDATMTRTMSTKTGQILSAAFFNRPSTRSTPQASPTREDVHQTPDATTPKSVSFKFRPRSSTIDSLPQSPSENGDSFKSATYFPPQPESEALMQGRRTASHDDPYQLAISAHHSTRNRIPSAPQHTSDPPPPPIPPRRRPGLMGSLQRALNAVSMSGDRSWSLTSPSDPTFPEGGLRTTSSSPTKDRLNRSSTTHSPTKTTPRRAASDGAALLRQKRGEKDWNPNEFPPYRDDPMAVADDWGEPIPPRSSSDLRQAEEDWDVEGAAGNRDFQVMFSVPKSRLRVVNDDMDRASLRSASDGVLSRSGSLRREGSIKPLKGLVMMRRDGGEGKRLSSTEEEAREG